uniref:RNA polymerase II-associated protein 3 n=1 Tax=Rhodosorus marinus TaxID=101924 RepID=A0A7S3EF88_9RHOD|mmetsp:Transcript_3189/g.14804  ORF Transcript_3189/g.14804 Transcript_3189/m.14804 type:complete len:422 (+) Transcript_3189:4613-5878(+)
MDDHVESDQEELKKEFEAWKEQIGREDEMLMKAEAEDEDKKSKETIVNKNSPPVLIEDIRSVEARERGNGLFGEGKFEMAVQWYDAAVQGAGSETDRAIAMNNRSLAKLKLGDAHGAAADAKEVLSHGTLDPKLQQKASLRLKAAQELLEMGEDALREKGNAAFKEGNLVAAMNLLTSSIEKRGEGLALGLSNRSLVSLKLKDYAAAEKDALAALRLDLPDQVRKKVLYRQATAVANQGRFQEAASLLESMICEYPDSTEAQSDLKTVKSKLASCQKEPQAEGFPATGLQFPTEVPLEAPASFYQFELLWRNFARKGLERHKLSLLKQISPEKLPRLFGESLSPEFVEDMAQALTQTEEEDHEWLMDVLEQLAKTRRFDLVLLSSPGAKPSFGELFDRLSREGKDQPSDVERINSLRRIYL